MHNFTRCCVALVCSSLIACSTAGNNSIETHSTVPLLSGDKVTTGWKAGPAWGLGVSVVQGNPNIVYVCGIDADKQSVLFGASQDGGKSWQAHKTQMQGTGCFVSVDPQQANDVVVGATTAPTDPTSPVHPATLWRSNDGGVNFTKLSLPGVTTDLPFSPTVAWVGSTLYVVEKNATMGGELLKSVNGGPLVFLIPTPSGNLLISSLGSIVLLQQHCPNNGYCNGIFWFMLIDGILSTDSPINSSNGFCEFSANSFDGQSSVIFCNQSSPMNPNTSIYYAYRDTFQGWSSLPIDSIVCPSLNDSSFASCNIAPDGTIYGFSNRSSAPMLVKLVQSNYFNVAVPALRDAVELFPQTWLGWNKAGHATVIWAVLENGGVEYHSLT